MQYEVTREQGQWHIQERGQTTRGTTVTDTWLEQMGFGRLTKRNIDAVVLAAAAAHRGAILDPAAARRMPKEINFTAGFKSYPTRIPERMLFRSDR